MITNNQPDPAHDNAAQAGSRRKLMPLTMALHLAAAHVEAAQRCAQLLPFDHPVVKMLENVYGDLIRRRRKRRFNDAWVLRNKERLRLKRNRLRQALRQESSKNF